MSTFLGCIECMQCSSTWLHCAKMAKQIKMLFGVNTPGGPWDIVFHGGLIPTDREGDLLLNFGTPRISRMAEATDWKLCAHTKG